MENIHKILLPEYLISAKKKLKLTSMLLLSLLLLSTSLVAQNKSMIKGLVVDDTNQPLIGATVIIKDVKNSGVITDTNGQFSLNVPEGKKVLVISYIGYKTQEVNISDNRFIKVKLSDNSLNMDEVVVVGYGKQKKASIVGSIAQTSGKVLERTGGVSSLAAALTGNLPGITTMTSSGKPGEEDPQIIIRGISSWNNSSPLILVDGIERAINSVDITSVESVSVLKDASATAVYGVRGANGVILITTKRGVEGKAKIEVGFSSTMKAPSVLPGKMDSYDALQVKNRAIEYELNQQPGSWVYMNSQPFINMYRNQTTQAQKERYPNIDWQKLEFKDYAMSYNANVNISGGTKFVKYFTAVDFVNEGDVVKLIPNDKGYQSGYDYNRVNSRANLDFQLTKTTKFLINLSGSYGKKRAPFNVITENYLWAGAYKTPPDIYYPKYSDGAWGYYPGNGTDAANSAMSLSIGGDGYTTTTRVASDFTLNQDLGMLLKGLSAKATVSLDNTFVETLRGIDMSTTYVSRQEYINPYTGIISYSNSADGLTNFDYYMQNNWVTKGGGMDNNQTYRNLNYQAQLFYEGRFGNHNVTAMGNFARQVQASGANIPSYRQDLVFRTTYAYKDKYFAEYNGAYNGSEKFAPANRFAFFSSGALGYMISEENFMKGLKFLDLLKLRVSYGQIGDDTMNGRWLYMDQMNNSTTQAQMSIITEGNSDYSTYTWNNQTQIGNPNISWEKVTKKNIGADFSIFKNLFSGSVDFFNDYRTNISLPGASRAVPSYFGFTPPTVNVGIVKVNGYELELKYSQKIGKNVHLWANASMTHAVDIVVNKDDPALYPEYLKAAGYPNNQSKSTISKGFYNSWDELYGSTAFSSADTKIPGNYRIVDFDCDGVIDGTKDRVRYGYPTNPQNTYNTTVGVDWKGFSAFVQFYGVNNVSRYIQVQSFSNGSLPFFNNVYTEGTYWSKNNMTADSPMPKVSNSLNGASEGTRYMYDGSYVRLKNAEIAYTFTSKWVRSIGLQSLRIFSNGNDLFLWTHTPDDREVSAINGNSYPTVRRYNLGLKLTL